MDLLPCTSLVADPDQTTLCIDRSIASSPSRSLAWVLMRALIGRYSSGLFYLHDNNSKFGTLALLKNDFVIKPEQTIAVQIGRTVISFALASKNQNNMNE